MAKLSKQDKIDLYNLWKNYGLGPKELSRRYHIRADNINYLVALIDRYGADILDRPYTNYSIEFKERAIKRVLVGQESYGRVSLDLGLKSQGMLANWVRSYKENGYNVLIKAKGRPTHESQRQADQAGKSSSQARKPRTYARRT